MSGGVQYLGDLIAEEEARLVDEARVQMEAERLACGAKFAKGGSAYPVLGREEFTPKTAPRKVESVVRPGCRSDYR